AMLPLLACCFVLRSVRRAWSARERRSRALRASSLSRARRRAPVRRSARPRRTSRRALPGARLPAAIGEAGSPETRAACVRRRRASPGRESGRRHPAHRSARPRAAVIGIALSGIVATVALAVRAAWRQTARPNASGTAARRPPFRAPVRWSGLPLADDVAVVVDARHALARVHDMVLAAEDVGADRQDQPADHPGHR